MGISSQQTGWSQEAKLIWQIAKELGIAVKVMSGTGGTVTTTTTVTPITTTTTTTVSVNSFISTWDTTNLSTGSSNNNQITLPLAGFTTYGMTVYWGDGASTFVDTGAFPVTHTYAVPGIYEIVMDIDPIEKLRGFFFNNTGDRLKITNISQWGAMSPLSNGTGFLYGCANVTITAIDTLDLSSTVVMDSYFRNCTSIVDIPNIGSWDLSTILSLSNTFFGATSFNADISGWDVSTVTNFSSTLRSCPAFSYSIGSWDISNATTISQIMTGKTNLTYSTANMDDIYNTWSTLTFVNTGLTTNFGTAKYSVAGIAGRAILTGAPNNWTITDGGL